MKTIVYSSDPTIYVDLKPIVARLDYAPKTGVTVIMAKANLSAADTAALGQAASEIAAELQIAADPARDLPAVVKQWDESDGLPPDSRTAFRHELIGCAWEARNSLRAEIAKLEAQLAETRRTLAHYNRMWNEVSRV